MLKREREAPPAFLVLVLLRDRLTHPRTIGLELARSSDAHDKLCPDKFNNGSRVCSDRQTDNRAPREG